MKLIIFGATGAVGLHLVKLALEQGHTVTAFTRSPQKVTPANNERLTIIRDDVLDPLTVERAITNQDAVLCALGMPLSNKDGLRAKGTANIIKAMQSAGTKRLICLSGLGVGNSHDWLPWHYRFFVIPVILRHVYADHERQESIIRKSGLNWTIARSSNFSSATFNGSYWHGATPSKKRLKLKMPHIEVAGFMLSQLTDNTYMQQAPGLSY